MYSAAPPIPSAAFGVFPLPFGVFVWCLIVKTRFNAAALVFLQDQHKINRGRRFLAFVP